MQKVNSWPAHLHVADCSSIKFIRGSGVKDFSTDDLLSLQRERHVQYYRHQRKYYNHSDLPSHVLRRTSSLLRGIQQNAECLKYHHPFPVVSSLDDVKSGEYYDFNLSSGMSSSFGLHRERYPHSRQIMSDQVHHPFDYSVQRFRAIAGSRYFDTVATWLEQGGPLLPFLHCISRVLLYLGIWEDFPGQGRQILEAAKFVEMKKKELDTMQMMTLSKWRGNNEDVSFYDNRNGLTSPISFGNRQRLTSCESLDARGSLWSISQDSQDDTNVTKKNKNLSKLNTCCRVHMPFPTLRTKVSAFIKTSCPKTPFFILSRNFFYLGG